MTGGCDSPGYAFNREISRKLRMSRFRITQVFAALPFVVVSTMIISIQVVAQDQGADKLSVVSLEARKKANRSYLVGLKSVGLLIICDEKLESRIRDTVELRLRQSKIKFQKSTAAPSPDRPILEVSLNGGANTWNMQLQLRERLVIPRNNVSLFPTSWEYATFSPSPGDKNKLELHLGETIPAATLADAISLIEAAVDTFCNDYLAANP